MYLYCSIGTASFFYRSGHLLSFAKSTRGSKFILASPVAYVTNKLAVFADYIAPVQSDIDSMNTHVLP